MEIKNIELVNRIGNKCTELGIDHEHLISILLLNAEITLPSISNIEELIKTELTARVASIETNAYAFRQQILNLHADAMPTPDRAIALAHESSDVAIAVLENETHDGEAQFGYDNVSNMQITLNDDLFQKLSAYAAVENVSINDAVNLVLTIALNSVPAEMVRLEAAFNALQGRIVNAQAGIYAARWQLTGLQADINNDPEKAQKIADRATEVAFKKILGADNE